MRYQHLILVFIIIFVCVALPIYFKTNLTAKSAHVNDNYANYLITATESSLLSVADSKQKDYVFVSDKKRHTAVNTFYEVLVKCFNYDLESTAIQNLVKYYVPCIFLIDTDGYYIEYTTTYEDSSGVACYGEIITPINKWSKTYSVGGSGLSGQTYHVEYHLDNTVAVIFKDVDDKIKTYSGYYEDVYVMLPDNKDSTLVALDYSNSANGVTKPFFEDIKTFEAEKNDVIINILNDQMEYYINVHDEAFFNQKNNVQYEFALPQITGEEWARLIDQPTVVSFLQGVQTPYDTSFLNIYSFAGSEVEKEKFYYISVDDKLYHEITCSSLSENDKEIGYTMEDAAKHGAYPCSDCIK